MYMYWLNEDIIGETALVPLKGTMTKADTRSSDGLGAQHRCPQKQALLQRRRRAGRQGFRAPNEGFESGFCCWIRGQCLHTSFLVARRRQYRQGDRGRHGE